MMGNRDLLTIEEAAHKMRYSVDWLRKRVQNREIEYIRPGGGRVLIDQSAIDEFLSRSIVKVKGNEES